MLDSFISLNGVGFSFASETASDKRLILRGVSLDIASGDFLCLLGPSGCGKSTLLNIMAGFERPSAGSAAVGGGSIAGPGADRMMVFQGDDSLFPWLTAAENVEFGLRVAGLPTNDRRQIAQDCVVFVGGPGEI